MVNLGMSISEGFNSSLKGLSPPLQVFTLSRMEQDGQVMAHRGFRAFALTVRAKVSNVDCEGPQSQLQFVGEPCVQFQAPAGKKQADVAMQASGGLAGLRTWGGPQGDQSKTPD